MCVNRFGLEWNLGCLRSIPWIFEILKHHATPAKIPTPTSAPDHPLHKLIENSQNGRCSDGFWRNAQSYQGISSDVKLDQEFRLVSSTPHLPCKQGAGGLKTPSRGTPPAPPLALCHPGHCEAHEVEFKTDCVPTFFPEQCTYALAISFGLMFFFSI